MASEKKSAKKTVKKEAHILSDKERQILLSDEERFERFEKNVERLLYHTKKIFVLKKELIRRYGAEIEKLREDVEKIKAHLEIE